MFFIYLFFSIGILATILLVLPTLVEITIYLISLFSNFKTAKENSKEVKKAMLDKKKEIKLAKLKKKYAETEEVEKEDVETEEVVEEVKEEPVVEPTAEVPVVEETQPVIEEPIQPTEPVITTQPTENI